MKRFISVIAILCAAMLIFSLTGCGESKKPENTTAATEAVTQAATEAPAEETTKAPAEDAAETNAEETSEAGGLVFEVGGMQIGVADPNAERPADAPEGGDGVTSLTGEELQAKQVEIAQSGKRKDMTYADFVEAIDGVEGKWTPIAFKNRWRYEWYATDDTKLEVIFNAETGLYEYYEYGDQ